MDRMRKKLANSGQQEKPRVGIALGSGSARGLAHLGVFRALEEFGLQVDVIAGTSIGALVGAVHAAGKIDRLEKTFQDFDWKKMALFFDVVFPKSGLIDGSKVSELVRSLVQSEAIEDLDKSFAAVATDITSGKEVWLQKGDVINAVRASISVPGIFTPVPLGEQILVDGGLTNPVPVSVARAMGADLVIAIDLNHDIISSKNLKASSKLANLVFAGKAASLVRWVGPYRKAMQDVRERLLARESPGARQFSRWISPREPLPNIFEVLLASINIMETRITEIRLNIEPPDILIRPPLGYVRFLEFGRAEEIIQIGYRSALEALQNSPLVSISKGS